MSYLAVRYSSNGVLSTDYVIFDRQSIQNAKKPIPLPASSNVKFNWSKQINLGEL